MMDQQGYLPQLLSQPRISNHAKDQVVGFALRKIQDPGATESGQNFSLLVNSAIDDIDPEQLEQYLSRRFGGADCNVTIETHKTPPDNKCILTVSISDAQTNNKYPTSEVLERFSQRKLYQRLNQTLSNNLVQLILLQDIGEEDLEKYLNRVPDGIDPEFWEYAKQKNPDQENFIPIPLLISDDLKTNRHSKKHRRVSTTGPQKRPSQPPVNRSILVYYIFSAFVIVISVAILIRALTQISDTKSDTGSQIKIDFDAIDSISTKYPRLLSHRDLRVIKTRLAIIRQEVSILMLLGQSKDSLCSEDVTFCIAQTIANAIQVEPAYIDAGSSRLNSSFLDVTLENSLEKIGNSVVIDSLERLPGSYVMNLFKFIDRYTPHNRRGLLLFVVYTGGIENVQNDHKSPTSMVENILIERWKKYIPVDTLDSVISRITGSIVRIARMN